MLDHRFEGHQDALGQWIRRDITPTDDEPGDGEPHVFVRRTPVSMPTHVNVVLPGAIPLEQALALYGHCRTVDDLSQI